AGGDQNLTGLLDLEALSLVPFEFIPHVPSFFALEDVEAYAKTAKHPVYALDDTTALKVINDDVEVITEGFWKLFDKK
ncbi:MAG: Type 1 glutamine amidotransferase-like domain-containing protein, partial [Patescibacteria group bacterium]